MNKVSLDAVARQQLERAAGSSSGRSAETVYGGHEHALRQTVIAMTAGVELAEHDAPGEATVLVLSGRVELIGQEATWSGRDGDLIVVPGHRHSLRAVESSAVLLTVVKR
jgi:quercetin dioxygenase-like cupin family protein